MSKVTRKVVQTATELSSATDGPVKQQELNLPSFNEAPEFVDVIRGRRLQRLGSTVGGDVVLVTVTGHVLTDDSNDDSFVRKCVVSIGDSYRVDGYCIGTVLYSGTGLVISKDNRYFFFTVDSAVNPPWKILSGTAGAEFWVNTEGEMVIRNIENLEIESLQEYY